MVVYVILAISCAGNVCGSHQMYNTGTYASAKACEEAAEPLKKRWPKAGIKCDFFIIDSKG